jgi:hypothetical protein
MDPERLLTDYTNADGRAPNGQDDATDDTAAFRQALAAGPGVVRLGPGFCRLGDVTIPSGVILAGAGQATVLRGNGAGSVISQDGVAGWAIRDLVVDGEAEGDWHDRCDHGRTGIRVNGCLDYEVASVSVRNFDGAGLCISWTAALGPGGWNSRSNLTRITASGNWIGIRFEERGEYVNASQLSCQNNVTGCVVYAGNVKLTGRNITSNIDGILVEDKDNGSHGAFSNCLVNHNERHALVCRRARNGMSIDNCCFFAGGILLEDCAGINITSGTISCPVSVTGSAANRIAGNYVIPDQATFQCSPATIVDGNFSAAGPWRSVATP